MSSHSYPKWPSAALDMTNPVVVPVRSDPGYDYHLSRTSSTVTRGKHCELRPKMAVTPICKIPLPLGPKPRMGRYISD